MSEVNTERLYSTTDAAVWAEEFHKVCPDVDEGLMIGWFANAIGTAKSSAQLVVIPVGVIEPGSVLKLTTERTITPEVTQELKYKLSDVAGHQEFVVVVVRPGDDVEVLDGGV